MCLCGAEVQPEAWGFQWRLHEGSGLHAHCTASVNAASAEQEMNYCSGQSGKYLTPLPSPSPNNPFGLPAWSANQVAKAPLVFPFFFFLKKKKVDESLILKNCAIQQTNFLFCLLSLLIYRTQLNIIEAGSWFAVWAIWRRISFFVIMPRRRPLWVTRHCLRPSFRKMSTTISIGVWSVTVKGLISRMLLSFNGRGLSAGRDGVCCAKHTRELPTIPSCFFLALSIAIVRSLLRANPTNRWDSFDIITGKPL